MEAELLAEIRKIYDYHDWANHQVLEAATKLTISEQESESDFVGVMPGSKLMVSP
jgi:hypothetical protein